jgi:hypothetical protein
VVEESAPAGAVFPHPQTHPHPLTGSDPALTEAPPTPVAERSRIRFRRPRRETFELQADWRWVEEWRRGGEPTPWGPGLALAVFAGLIIGSAVYVITIGLADNPWVAVAANVVVAAGLSPALWMSRGLPVLRWIALGGAMGTVGAWISVLFFPHV